MDVQMTLAAIQNERDFDARRAALVAIARSEVATDAPRTRRWATARERVLWLMHRAAAETREDAPVPQVAR